MPNPGHEADQDQNRQGASETGRRSGRTRSVLRWTGMSVAAAFGLLAVAILVVTTFGISIDLSSLRPRIESAASEALGRSVVIEGPISLVPTLHPTVQVEGIAVGQPGDWPDAEFARLDLARGQLSVLPLLRGDLQIEEVTVAGLTLNLEIDAAGERNWIVATDEPSEQSDEQEGSSPVLQVIELRDLSLSDIVVTLRDASAGSDTRLRIDEITGSAEDRQPMQLAVRGSVDEAPFELTLDAGSLAALIDGDAVWPVEIDASALDTRLTISGEIAEPLLGKGLALQFALRGPRVEELESMLGLELPPFPSIDLRGSIAESEGLYSLTELEGALGESGISGALEIDTQAEIPRLTGAIDLPSIDLTLISAAIAREAESVEGDAQPTPTAVADGQEEGSSVDLDEPVLTLDMLEGFDADFSLTVGEVIGGATSIRDAEFRVTVADGRLIGPVNANVAEVPFSGEVRLVPRDGMPAARASLSARGSDIGELLATLTGAEDIEGAFDTVELQISAGGESIRSIVESTELRFTLAGASLSYGNNEGGNPVEFTLDSFDMLFPAAAESRISAAGSLLGEPFSLELSGGTFIENYIERNWPFDLTATGGGAEFRLYGKAATVADSPSSELTFSVRGERVGDLASWIGVRPEADLPYALNGGVTLGDQTLLASVDEARLGETSFGGTVGVVTQDGPPVTLIDLAFGVIDAGQLAGLFPEKEEEETEDSAREALTIDVPILPSGIELLDSDIGLAIERIKMRASDVEDFTFSAQIREGYMPSAPLYAVVAGAPFDGSLSIDLRDDIPEFDVKVQSTDVQIGEILEELGVAQGLDVTAGAFDMSLSLRGADVRTQLRRSEFSAAIRDGRMRLSDPNTGGSLEIGIPEGTIGATAGAPIELLLDGRIEDTPIRIGIETDSLASFADPKTSLGATLTVDLLDAELELSGSTPLPLAPDNLRFALDLSGGRVDAFDDLLGVSLPPWGPYGLTGRFGSRPSGYFIEDFRVEAGSSELTGSLDLDTTVTPPRLDIDLFAPTIQLDDFETGDWSPAGSSAGAADEAPVAEPVETDATARNAASELLSPEVMRSLDGSLSIIVQEVRSGEDRLGSGTLETVLAGGRLAVDPLTLNIPGGSVDVGFALEPTETDIALEARAAIDRLDYGVLARRIDPEATTGGLISLDVDLTTRGADLSDIMAGSNGYIDLAVWPQDLNAGLFDLWAVNLFTAVLPSLDSEQSTVNCVVGRFQLDDGVMSTTALLLDTSRIQASGEGTVDFRDNAIIFRAAPSSKQPQMFAARTPIEIQGKISDFEFGLQSGAIVGTAFRMITSPVVVPFQWIFEESVAADGEAACREAWGRPAES